MNTDNVRRRHDEGFTLIEVLIALVILAVGLLGLEALGIHASRLVARAAHQSDFVALATDSLESYTAQIRNGANPASRTGTVNGATIRIDVTTALPLRTVTITVIPQPGATNRPLLLPRDSIRIAANVYQ